MKNGRGLQGHKRIVTGHGVHPKQRPAPGGYSVGCVCGWAAPEKFSRTGPAHESYRAHVDDQIDNQPILCKVCGESKPVDEMRTDYRHMCRSCFSKHGTEWQRRNPVATARHKRDHHLRKTFGISADYADELLRRQGGLCAICREPISDRRGYAPHLDHDHDSGMVRGILCFGCNVGLGNFGDDVARLRAAADYLERNAGRLRELPDAVAALL